MSVSVNYTIYFSYFRSISLHFNDVKQLPCSGVLVPWSESQKKND